MNTKTERLRMKIRAGERDRARDRSTDTERVKWRVREHRKENDLAVTQLDHYLLLHKCDVVEKVKLIVWK